MPKLVKVEAPGTVPVCLTIAGSDSSGGAGLQVDLAVFRALGCSGASVVACVTAQSHTELRRVTPMEPSCVRDQLEVVLESIPVGAIKIGALGSAAVVEVVADVLHRYPDLPLVIDPVVLSTSGSRLLETDGVAALVHTLIPHASLVTPNIPEAQLLAGMPDVVDTERLAKALWQRWQVPVLVKGGHGNSDTVRDSLCDGTSVQSYDSPRLPIGNVRGTGCALASAIAAALATGKTLRAAIEEARSHLQRWMGHAPLVAEQRVLMPPAR